MLNFYFSKLFLSLFFETFFEIVLRNMVIILNIAAKMATLGLLEITTMTSSFLPMTSPKKYHVTQIIL